MSIVTTAASETRQRGLIAGAWLIGIGSVFLVKQVSGWAWSEAWPLLVILVGGGGVVSTALRSHRSRIGLWSTWWPLTVLVVGVVLLLSTTGSIAITPAELARLWPVAVIALGLSLLMGAFVVQERGVSLERIALPLDGLAAADIRLKFGGGELQVGRAPAGSLITGDFDGGVIQRSRGPGTIELEPFDPGPRFMSGRPLRWDMGITAEIPVDLRLETGANRSTVDLSGLRIRRLELATGASETRIRLPLAGQTSVSVEAGVAAVTLEVPPGVAARVSGRVALGSTNVDERRFPPSSDGWSSPDYETATNRVEILIEGGLGSVRVG